MKTRRRGLKLKTTNVRLMVALEVKSGDHHHGQPMFNWRFSKINVTYTTYDSHFSNNLTKVMTENHHKTNNKIKSNRKIVFRLLFFFQWTEPVFFLYCLQQKKKAIWAWSSGEHWASEFSGQTVPQLPFMESRAASQSCTWDAGWKTKHLSCFNLSPQRCLGQTPLTWYFILSSELLTPKTKGRSCEQHGTLYLCSENEIFSRSSVGNESEKLLCEEDPPVVARCWCLIMEMSFSIDDTSD